MSYNRRVQILFRPALFFVLCVCIHGESLRFIQASIPEQPGWFTVRLPKLDWSLKTYLISDYEISEAAQLNPNFLVLKIQDSHHLDSALYQVFENSGEGLQIVYESPVGKNPRYWVNAQQAHFSREYAYFEDLSISPSHVVQVFALKPGFPSQGPDRFQRSQGVRGYFHEIHYFWWLKDWERSGEAIDFLLRSLQKEELFLLSPKQRKEFLSRAYLLKADLYFELNQAYQGREVYEKLIRLFPKTTSGLSAAAELDRWNRLGKEVYLRLRD